MHIKGKSNLWKQQAKGASEVAQSCPTLCDTVDYSPPGSSVHRILQARIPDGSSGKESGCSAENMGSIPGLEKSPGDVFSLAWEIPWTEEPGELQSMGSKKSQTQLSSNTFILVNSFYSKYWLYICFLMILFISYSKDIHFLLILGTFYFAEKR